MNSELYQRVKSPFGAASSSLLALTTLLSLAACGPATPDQSAREISPMRVPVASPEAAPGYAAEHIFSGQIEAARTAALGFELGGLLRSVQVEEGARVAAGEVLARLDTDRLAAARREREAAVLDARSQVSLAEATLARVDEALGYRGVSRQEVDEARDARDRATAALALAEARLASIDVDLDKSALRAPFAGTIAARRVDEGAVVAAGAPILVLEESGHLRARVGVSGELARALTAGDDESLEGPTGTLDATVHAVLPVRNAVTRTVDVLFDLPRGDTLDLRPGDLVQLTLAEYRAREGHWLPLAALTEGERGLWSTLVVEGGNASEYRVTQRIVEVAYHDAQRVFVTSGIRDEDLLVVDGTHRVVVGQRVAPSGPAVADAVPGDVTGER
ncbi:MAG: efflux RND transporter periplasmic adaptor subunit [Pseudomonadota bacterium]